MLKIKSVLWFDKLRLYRSRIIARMAETIFTFYRPSLKCEFFTNVEEFIQEHPSLLMWLDKRWSKILLLRRWYCCWNCFKNGLTSCLCWDGDWTLDNIHAGLNLMVMQLWLFLPSTVGCFWKTDQKIIFLHFTDIWYDEIQIHEIQIHSCPIKGSAGQQLKDWELHHSFWTIPSRRLCSPHLLLSVDK